MIKSVDFEIVGSYNNQRTSSIDAERSVNLFEYIDPLGKKTKSLISTSGLTNVNYNFGAETGGFRGEFVFLGNHYVVIGSSAFLINNAGNVSLLGTLATSTGYVGIDGNTFQVIFVDGQDGYIWDTNATTFTTITDTSFPVDPIDVCYLDGFFIVANGGTNTFQLSTINEGLQWGPDSQTFTADHTVGNNWLILASTANYQTGVAFTLSNSGGALPSPLTAGTIYYSIRINSTHIRVATSYANAIAGTAITLTNDGSGTNTITSIGQLQQGAMTTHPGTIVACRTLHRRLFLFSQFYTEVWENAGIGTNLPFRRNNALLIEYGTPAIGSISVSFDMLFFLSQDRDGFGSVMMVTGTQAIPTSTRALDFQLSQYASSGKVSDCRGFLIKENGLIFYRMNFTAANHTFVYNVSQSNPAQDQTKYWHEEEVLNGNRHPAQTHAYFNGINYVGDYASPILYILDSNNYTNNGETIRRMRIGKAIVPPGYQRMRIDRIQFDLLQGNATTPLDTELFFSVSKDGGQSYGNRLRAPMGNVGERTFRTLFRKLGTIPRGQAFVPKIEFFAPIPFVLLGASWSVEILPE